MKVNPGEFVALVGGSGSGKSTLFRILLGFEEYESGTVFFDMNDMKDLDIRILRDQLGVVLQDGKIMQGTVLYNIIGTSTFTEDDAWEAARMAGCDKDIEKLENQMQTELPAGGGTLSGGQKQRIVIARALIKKPRILLFDEATSSLDNDTQQTVTTNVDKLDATRIVIAHRLSTIRGADRIFVLEQGEIVETGKYDELIEKKGWFYQLVKNQIAKP
jgi:ATP-binding cassette subfamily C protein